jgi:hypothetical protein
MVQRLVNTASEDMSLPSVFLRPRKGEMENRCFQGNSRESKPNETKVNADIFHTNVGKIRFYHTNESGKWDREIGG